jgi:hypothetical protein
MAAITWRNVDGPSLSEASRPLDSAARLIDNAFSRVGNVIEDQQKVGFDNWDQVKENNTQAFLDRLYSAQGADGFKALQDSGELDRMIAANGAQIDRARARSAMDGRLATLQQRDVAGITYKNTMLDDAQAAEVREIGLLTLTDPAAAQARLAAKPELRAAVQLAQGIDNRRQELVNRDRATTEFDWKGAGEQREADKFPLVLDGLRSALQNDRVQRGYTSALTERTLTDIDNNAEDRAATRNKNVLTNALKDNRYNEGVLVPGGSSELMGLIIENNIGDDKGWWNDSREKQAKIVERIERLASKGHTVQIPDPNNPGKTVTTTVPYALKDVKAALLSATDRTASWNEGWADTFEEALLKRYNVDGLSVEGKPGRIARGQTTNLPKAKPGQVISPIVQDFRDYSGIMQSGINSQSSSKPKK